MNQDELDKKLKKQEILVKDEKVWSLTYVEIILALSLNRQKRQDAFNDLPGKGKPLNLDKDLSYNPDKQLYRTLKNNHVFLGGLSFQRKLII